MDHPKVAIVGYGAVGSALHGLFPDAVVYDEPKHLYSSDPRFRTHDSDPRETGRDAVNACDFAFICVPTPQCADGSCDTSIVEDVVGWIEAKTIVIRSTIAPGTTERLRYTTGKAIVFMPEYGPGETPDHPFNSPRAASWIILGGDRKDTQKVAQLYQSLFNSELHIGQADATTAEMVKYMENAFLAVKVAFCNEVFGIAQTVGVDYNEARELWLLDPRIGRSHTWVHPDNRGFGGRCLPKDLMALLAVADSPVPVLSAAMAWSQS